MFFRAEPDIQVGTVIAFLEDILGDGELIDLIRPADNGQHPLAGNGAEGKDILSQSDPGMEKGKHSYQQPPDRRDQQHDS